MDPNRHNNYNLMINDNLSISSFRQDERIQSAEKVSTLKDGPFPESIKRSQSETQLPNDLGNMYKFTKPLYHAKTVLCENCGSNMKRVPIKNINRKKTLNTQLSTENFNLDANKSFYGSNVPAAAYALAWATEKHKRFRSNRGISCSSGDDSMCQSTRVMPEFIEEYKKNKVLIENAGSRRNKSQDLAFCKEESPNRTFIAKAIGKTAIGPTALVGSDNQKRLTNILKKNKDRTLESDSSDASQNSKEPTATGVGIKSDRVQKRRGGGEVKRVIAPGGPLGAGVQPLMLNREKQTNSRSIGWRLSRRKLLNERRKKIFDYSLAFAVFGIFVVVLETEFTLTKVYNKGEVYSILMKSLISASTGLLIMLIIAYNVVEIQLFSVNNCIEDWRIATNSRRIINCLIEILICIIHPPPFHINYGWQVTINDREYKPTNSTKVLNTKPPVEAINKPPIMPDNIDTFFLHIDDILALIMFFRLYLIFRLLLLHSKMFTDTSSRSIGALNRVQFNIRFVLKTFMTMCPGTILLVFILTFWIIFSWFMRVCERSHSGMQETMWLIAITFLSIGYGDVVPHGPCGRSIAVVTGVLGSCCTALVVAVFARKLELTKAEKHVHNFMQDNKIYKQLRNAAANVLRETWFFYKYTKLVKRVHPSKIRSHQRKFLCAIHSLRKAKEDHRKLKDDASSMVDLGKLQTSIYETILHIRSDQNVLNNKFQSFEDNLNLFRVELNRFSNKQNVNEYSRVMNNNRI